MTLVSVILPFRDAESTLGAAIKSILSQTLSNFELVLIDDNSVDSSVEIAKGFKDKRIRLLKNPHCGLVQALNFGVSNAKGEFIARMDADDVSLSNRLQLQYEHLNNLPDNYVCSCLVNHVKHGNENTLGYQWHSNWLNNIISPREHYLNRFTDAVIAHPTLFCRKYLFTTYGNYKDSAHPEDFELWLRWMSQGVRFEKVQEPLYEWHDFPDRLSRKHANYALDRFYELKARYFASWYSRQQSKQLWIVGFGKDVFGRSAFLEQNHLSIDGYVDVKARPNSKRQVISYDMVHKGDGRFYLVYVSDRLGKDRIESFFAEKGINAGEDYLLMA